MPHEVTLWASVRLREYAARECFDYIINDWKVALGFSSKGEKAEKA